MSADNPLDRHCWRVHTIIDADNTAWSCDWCGLVARGPRLDGPPLTTCDLGPWRNLTPPNHCWWCEGCAAPATLELIITRDHTDTRRLGWALCHRCLSVAGVRL